MADTLQLELVSPAKLLMSESVGMVVVPGIEGYFGVLPDHMPLLSTLRPGVVSVHDGVTDAPAKQFFVDGGFAEVNPEGCTLLVDEAIAIDEITADNIAERRSAAEELIQSADTDGDRAAAEKKLFIVEEMARAMAEAAA
ncbi:MAG: F0F1 ATP synthase subunit epsilon [Rhodospirillaceae bacterium]|nr:F0F1 ATP synthase subunit epsilon [Rhodospirillaceae bacterium]